MLRPEEYGHLTAEDWEKIAKKILKDKLKKGQQIIMFSSDEHEGGVTSFMPQVGKLVEGFGRRAITWIKNGDNFEYQSPADLTEKIGEMIRQHIARNNRELQKMSEAISGQGNTYEYLALVALTRKMEGMVEEYVTEHKMELQKVAQDMLLKKIEDDTAALEKQIIVAQEKSKIDGKKRRIVKIIGNHENCKAVRDKLDALEKKYPGIFQWTPELELIRAPGGKKEKSDVILAFHGDLQMDDVGIVEDGYTDKQRPIYTLEEMAEKAVGIATRKWLPSAQKQENYQKIVSWWRKPKPTAKTILSELNRAAQNAEGFRAQKINLKQADEALEMLEKQKNKFEKFRIKLENNEALTTEEDGMRQELGEYGLTIGDQIRQLDGKIVELANKEQAMQAKSHIFLTGKDAAEKWRLSYKRPGKGKIKVLTPKILERVTHMNYGHTHVPCEEIKIDGITFSNNGSVTWAPMQAHDGGNDAGDQQQKTAALRYLAKFMHMVGDTYKGVKNIVGLTEPPEKMPDLRNLGALLYVVEDGKVKENYAPPAKPGV